VERKEAAAGVAGVELGDEVGVVVCSRALGRRRQASNRVARPATRLAHG
jgi:hypothetical protein